MENREPVNDPEGEVEAVNQSVATSADPVNETLIDPPRRRAWWLHLIIVLLQTVFLLPLYAVLLAVAVGAGVGWHYFDKSASLDLDLVNQQEVGALIKDSQGVTIGRAFSMNRILIKREDIPSHFVDALIAAEDQRFFLHPGFDPAGSVRAAIANYRAEGIREGGSTLTQQLARDVFKLEGKHIDRKLSEIAAAVRIEKRYSKDEILVNYLNRIYFGSGFYGLGAAARGYFGKKASELTVDESALICGVIPSPSRYSPLVSAERAREFRDQTLRRMHEIGKLEKSELDRLLASDTPVASSPDDARMRGQISYLVGRVERELRQLTETWSGAPKSLEGFTIETSVDLAAQQEAAKEIGRHLANLVDAKSVSGDALEAAFVLVENDSGEVIVSVGSQDYQRSEFDRTLATKRPPGSAFLPFLYAAAYETGMFTPETRLSDAPFDNRYIGLGSVGGVLGEWSTEDPGNRWEGAITAARALEKSKNSPAARLGLLVGLPSLRELVRKTGIQSEIRDVPASLLGASEMTLTELTHAYTAFANDGRSAPPPHLIRGMIDPLGKPVALPANDRPAPAMKESTARAIASSIPLDEKGARGKSGTTATYTDAWHFGFDATHTWGVWVGRDRFSPIGAQAFGKEIASPLAAALAAQRSVNGGRMASSQPKP